MKIKKNLLNIIFFSILIIFQTNAFAITKNKIIAKVDNHIVSSYELKNKIKTILFLANQDIDQENINFIKQKALQQLIDYKLKKNQVTEFKVQLNDNTQINNYLNNLSLKFKTDIPGLKKIF